MIYVKSFLAGLAAFIILSVLTVGATFLAPVVMERLPFSGGGVGFVAFPIWPIVTALLIISGAVSYRFFKKARRSQSGFTRPDRSI